MQTEMKNLALTGGQKIWDWPMVQYPEKLLNRDNVSLKDKWRDMIKNQTVPEKYISVAGYLVMF